MSATIGRNGKEIYILIAIVSDRHSVESRGHSWYSGCMRDVSSVCVRRKRKRKRRRRGKAGGLNTLGCPP